MQGPPLTPQETVASVAHRVRRLEAQGLDRNRAIQRTAIEIGLDPLRVRWCADTALPPVRRSPSPRRRRGAWPWPPRFARTSGGRRGPRPVVLPAPAE